MRILTALTYYRPHYSGLTIYAERLVRALADRGHEVTVLTSRYDQSLALRESQDGVQVIRLPVLMRISKGVLLPSMPAVAWNLIGKSDVVHLHVPQLDAAYLALIGQVLRKPVVLTYHCDLQLPKGFIHWIANQVSHLANHVAARAANVIVTNTQDYAINSDFLKSYLEKLRVIRPPIELKTSTQEEIRNFKRKHRIQPEDRIIGMAARLAAEKGVEVLIQALPEVLQVHPNARVLFVGQHEDVLGEEVYAARLKPLIEGLKGKWRFLGVISPHELNAFFNVSDVIVAPSLNSTESFGMVQVEAMTCGTPVVASNLPGVRRPVGITGMGRVIPVGEAHELALAIIDVLNTPGNYRGDPLSVAEQFSPATIASQYETLFKELYLRNSVKAEFDPRGRELNEIDRS